MYRDLRFVSTLLLLVALFTIAPTAATTIIVDSTFDDFDQGANGNCTLREAILAANTNAAVDGCLAGEQGPGTTDRILLPPGTFLLAIGGSGEDNAQQGDLDLLDTVSIEGSGARVTIIDGAGLDRVFDVDPSQNGLPVAILELTIRGGDTGGSGGGLRNGGTLTLDRCSLDGNHAGGPGGGIRNDFDLFVLDSAIRGNSTDDHGGGLDDHGLSFIQNTTVSGNAVNGGGVGGGLYNLGGGTMTLISTTIVGNSAGAGEAIHNAGTLTVTNVLVVGDCDATVEVTNGGSLESPGDSCGLNAPSDQVNVADPLLGTLSDNGGPTDTHLPLTGSPAIDRGETALCLTTDQRGAPRPIDGDDDQVADCDVGAVEISIEAEIFADGFESGDTGAWSTSTGS